jgi:hypothetical protein
VSITVLRSVLCISRRCIRIVDDDIDTAIGIHGSLDDSITILDRVKVGNRLTTSCFDFLNNLLGWSGSRTLQQFVEVNKPTSGEHNMHENSKHTSPRTPVPRSLTTTLAPREPNNKA